MFSSVFQSYLRTEGSEKENFHKWELIIIIIIIIIIIMGQGESVLCNFAEGAPMPKGIENPEKEELRC